MVTPGYISPKIRVQIEEKLFSIINFKGRRPEEVKKTLVTAALTKDSVENKAEEFGILPKTVRDYVQEQPQVLDQMLNVIKTISVKELGKKRVKISIDYTSIEYKENP